MKRDVYQMVTDKIVDELSKGIIPWHKPWMMTGQGCISYTSRKPYSLLNQMLLGEPGEYVTWNQVHNLGGSVNKGAKSRMVVFFTMVESKTEVDEDGNPKMYPMLRYYNVFHIKDTTLESKLGDAPTTDLQPIEAAERIINGYLARETDLQFHNDQPSDNAFYSPSRDAVVVPMLSQYQVAEEYYSTTFHELVHSTMKKSRCDREGDNRNAAFGSKDYSREELVAEIGSAMLCSISGIDSEKAFKNSVAYIQGWLKSLANDKHMIVWASSRAEKAADYISRPSDSK